MRCPGLIAALLLVFSGSLLHAQDALIDVSGGAAHVSRARPGGRLQPPFANSRVETVREFLRSRHDAATVRDLVQTREDASGNLVHLRFGQQVAGLAVYGTYVKAALSRDGDLLSVVENLVSTARALRPAVVLPSQALAAVLATHYPGIPNDLREVEAHGNTVVFEQPVSFDEPPTVTRVALPLRGQVLATGYLVVTWDQNNVLRHTIVSGNGRIVGEQLRTNQDSYLIFPNSPGVSGQETVTNPADPIASPDGWVATNTTIGNNVDAYLDRDNNNAADAAGRPTAEDQNFQFLWSAADAPTTAANQRAAVTNLFYLNNRIHDILHRWGFDEQAGNFQMDNFGQGGAGGDPVNAEAQDGGGTDNANFATPPDGARPRMQMYLWTSASPNRDGDLDADIVWHEYGHGLTWRVIGDMSGPLAGAIGEGMSDVLAIYVNGDDRVAEYSYNNPAGIRSAPYTNYPNTYGLVTGSSVHFDGEIYAAAMWRLRELWLAEGWSQEHLMRWVVDGMKHTPSRPAYEDMRDGILASMSTLDLSTSGAPSPEEARCKVWEAFAGQGIGEGANGEEVCIFGIFCLAQVTESFLVPAECTGGSTNAPPEVTIVAPASGTTVAEGTPVTFTATANDQEDGDVSASLVWTSSQHSSPIGTGASFSTATLAPGTHTITASATDGEASTGSDQITLQVESGGTDPTEPEFVLTGTGQKTKGVRAASLDWSGGGIIVSIIRDGTVIEPSLLNGYHYDDTTLGKGGKEVTYQVCDALFPTSCSNLLTLRF